MAKKRGGRNDEGEGTLGERGHGEESKRKNSGNGECYSRKENTDGEQKIKYFRNWTNINNRKQMRRFRKGQRIKRFKIKKGILINDL